MDTKKIDRIPLNSTFELTARCNLQCKMCLIRIDNKRISELGGRERTAEEWIQMAREIKEAGTIGLLLTGGEPMLRPDFIEIYKEIAQMGFILTLYTNATLITSEIMEVLKEYPPHLIGVTVYGASPESYEKVTGNANAYYRMIEGVKQLRRLPSKFTIRTTLIKDNIKELDEITKWAFGFGNDVEFNVSRIVTKPVRGGIANVEECRLTPKQNVAMLEERNMEFILKPFEKFIYDMRELEIKSEVPIAELLEKNVNTNKGTTLYGCDAGINSFTITWDGKLIGCQMLGDCWTFPYEDGFQNAWKEFPNKVKLPELPQKCISCKLECNACPATRLAETGSLCGIPEYLCMESMLTNEMNIKLMSKVQNIIKERDIG